MFGKSCVGRASLPRAGAGALPPGGKVAYGRVFDGSQPASVGGGGGGGEDKAEPRYLPGEDIRADVSENKKAINIVYFFPAPPQRRPRLRRLWPSPPSSIWSLEG